IDDTGHRIGDDFPILRVDRNLSSVRHAGGWNHAWRQITRVGHMRTNEQSAHRDGSQGARHLDWGRGNRTLADAHGDRFARVPLLFEITDLPLFRRHNTGDFLRKVDAGLLPEPECRGVLGDAIDAKFFSQGVEIYVTRLINGLADVGNTVDAVLRDD